MDDNKSFVTVVALVVCLLIILILNITYGKKQKVDAAKESYVACLEAQKGTPVDLNCGNVKEVK